MSISSLALLSEWFQTGKKITAYSKDGKEVDILQWTHEQPHMHYLSFTTSLCFPINTETSLKSSREESHYTLGALYFMMIKHDSSYAEYLQACRSIGIPSVSLVDRKEATSYLSGKTIATTLMDALWQESNRSIHLDTIINPLKIEGSDKEFSTSKILQEQAVLIDEPEQISNIIIVQEKPLHAKNKIFLSKNKPYAQSISLMKNLLKSTLQTKSSHSRQVQRSKIPGTDDVPTSLLLPTSIGSHNPRTLLDQITLGSNLLTEEIQIPKIQTIPSHSSQKIQYPIIIVPMSTSSLMNIYNIKDFLENGRFVTPEEAKFKSQKRESVVIVNRKPTSYLPLPISDQQIITYHVIDSCHRLRANDWNRVVAVFAQGTTWQFKGWKYDNPVDVFSHYKGFHVKYEDTTADSSIRSWDVTILSVHRTKRHLDRQILVNFWQKLDKWIMSNSPNLLKSQSPNSIQHRTEI